MMNKLRRSFRNSFRGRRDKISETGNVTQWQSDEMSVRQSNCVFPVKYLGCLEVSESRGMPICEDALKLMRASKKKSTRGSLFISADALRVVDGETRGLIVDQTIEKVSFCSPDRNHDRGFAYICRDGTTRRWICHGFHAMGVSGERLSHAVGCAFAICLEKKQKRDKEAVGAPASSCNNSVTNAQIYPVKISQTLALNSTLPNKSDPSTGLRSNIAQLKQFIPKNPEFKNNNFVKNSPFRQTISISDRRYDPQTCKLSVPPPPVKPVINPYAIDRPHATPLMLQRQTSFRPLSNLKSQSPFKRQLSLKLSQSSQMALRHSNSLQPEPTFIATKDLISIDDNQEQLIASPPMVSQRLCV